MVVVVGGGLWMLTGAALSVRRRLSIAPLFFHLFSVCVFVCVLGCEFVCVCFVGLLIWWLVCLFV